MGSHDTPRLLDEAILSAVDRRRKTRHRSADLPGFHRRAALSTRPLNQAQRHQARKPSCCIAPPMNLVRHREFYHVSMSFSNNHYPGNCARIKGKSDASGTSHLAQLTWARMSGNGVCHFPKNAGGIELTY